MRKLAINIVWIKRDLRTLDHESFHAAESKNIPYLPVYIFDNDLIDYPDTSDRHLGFIYNSLIDINSVCYALEARSIAVARPCGGEAPRR